MASKQRANQGVRAYSATAMTKPFSGRKTGQEDSDWTPFACADAAARDLGVSQGASGHRQVLQWERRP